MGESRCHGNSLTMSTNKSKKEQIQLIQKRMDEKIKKLNFAATKAKT
jgi:hypothetical protein